MADKAKSRRYAIEAKCFDCTGGYSDGRKDCENPRCPLYAWMPYRHKTPDTGWVEWPARVQRNLSDDKKKAISERMLKGRQDRVTDFDSTSSTST